jgi:hypothetical protein
MAYMLSSIKALVTGSEILPFSEFAFSPSEFVLSETLSLMCILFNRARVAYPLLKATVRAIFRAYYD